MTVYKKVIKMDFRGVQNFPLFVVNWHICRMFWKSQLDLRCWPDTCQKKEKKKNEEITEGFKESREAAINVILSLGFSVNELGDHIPNPQTHSSHTKLFLQLSPKSKEEKTPSVDKSQANEPNLLATVCSSLLKHESPPVIHIYVLLSSVHTINIHLVGHENRLEEVWTYRNTTGRMNRGVSGQSKES